MAELHLLNPRLWTWSNAKHVRLLEQHIHITHIIAFYSDFKSNNDFPTIINHSSPYSNHSLTNCWNNPSPLRNELWSQSFTEYFNKIFSHKMSTERQILLGVLQIAFRSALFTNSTVYNSHRSLVIACMLLPQIRANLISKIIPSS